MNVQAQNLYNELNQKIKEIDLITRKLNELPADELYNLPSYMNNAFASFGEMMAYIVYHFNEAVIKGHIARDVMKSKECWYMQSEHSWHKNQSPMNPWGSFSALAFTESEARYKFMELESKEHSTGVGSRKGKVKYNYNVFHFKDGTTTPVDVAAWRENKG